MEGQEVIGQDDHKIGTIVAEQDGIAVVEVGHVFKSKYAIPQQFLHEHDGEVRATVAKEIVTDSPKLEADDIDVNAVKLHYGPIDPTVADPDPNAVEDAAGGTDESPIEAPASFDQPTNSADPSWSAHDRD